MTAATCSTPNISHTRNSSGPRLPISARPWTRAQRLIDERGISQREIADESGVPLASVNRALSIRWCGRTNFAAVLRVRMAVERLLSADGLGPLASRQLWAEYDVQLLETAA